MLIGINFLSPGERANEDVVGNGIVANCNLYRDRGSI